MVSEIGFLDLVEWAGCAAVPLLSRAPSVVVLATHCCWDLWAASDPKFGWADRAGNLTPVC